MPLTFIQGILMLLNRQLPVFTLSCILISICACSSSAIRQGVLPDNSRYEGQLVDGLLNGYGKISAADGSHYEGEFSEGLYSGEGKLVFKNGNSYQGQFAKGMPNGRGVLHFTNGGHYEGDVKDGEMHGKGIYTSAEGGRFEGEFNKDALNGQGIFIGNEKTAKGFRYEGNFANWLYNGQGQLTLADGSHYEGEFLQGHYHGQGKFTDAQGNYYIGEFAYGRYHGKGTFTYSKPYRGITTFTGRWKYGEVIEADKPGIIFDTAALVETALYNQIELIDAQLVKIDTERSNAVDVFFVGVAGDGRQDVFLREVKTVSEVMAEHLNTGNRQIILANNRHTSDELPMATLKSLDYTLEAVGQMMGDEDILFLYMTSHGSKPEDNKSTEFILGQSGMDLHDLSPSALKKILDKHHLPHQVVIVSACYSGGFIPPLRNDKRLVISSSSAEDTSFGCSDEEDMTYFGDALFKHGLNKTTDISKAFRFAKQHVTKREVSENIKPSEPQISHAPALVKQWQRMMDERKSR
jgi:hypothetical protein